jgi:hypothetical protein
MAIRNSFCNKLDLIKDLWILVLEEVLPFERVSIMDFALFHEKFGLYNV